jgi:hypothetical protein
MTEYGNNSITSKYGAATYKYSDNSFIYTYKGQLIFEITKDEIEMLVDSAELLLPEHYLDAGYKIYIDWCRKE